MTTLDDQDLPLPCLNCGEQTRKTIAWIRKHNEFTCACGSVIRFDSEELRKKLMDTDAHIQQLLYKIKGITRH